MVWLGAIGHKKRKNLKMAGIHWTLNHAQGYSFTLLDFKSPVKYAQSWTMAVLVTSIFRSLGMAARVIHAEKVGIDGNHNLLIDTCRDERRLVFTEGVLCDSDFVFGHHSWTEVWMARKDLSVSYPYYTYAAWQVVDGTAGYFDGHIKTPFGPAPVYAIKNGDVDVPFNTTSAFAMISSPSVRWVVDSTTKEIQGPIHLSLNETGLTVAYDDQGNMLTVTNLYKSTNIGFRMVSLHRALVRSGNDNSILDELLTEEANELSSASSSSSDMRRDFMVNKYVI